MNLATGTQTQLVVGTPANDFFGIAINAVAAVLFAAPLIAGNDLRTMSAETRAVLTNRAVIAVNQDPPGAGWMIVLKPDDPAAANALMDAAAYERLVASETK